MRPKPNGAEIKLLLRSTRNSAVLEGVPRELMKVKKFPAGMPVILLNERSIEGNLEAADSAENDPVKSDNLLRLSGREVNDASHALPQAVGMPPVN